MSRHQSSRGEPTIGEKPGRGGQNPPSTPTPPPSDPPPSVTPPADTGGSGPMTGTKPIIERTPPPVTKPEPVQDNPFPDAPPPEAPPPPPAVRITPRQSAPRVNRTRPKPPQEFAATIVSRGEILPINYGDVRVPAHLVLFDYLPPSWTFLWVFGYGELPANSLNRIWLGDSTALFSDATAMGRLLGTSVSNVFDGTPTQDIGVIVNPTTNFPYTDVLPNIQGYHCQIGYSRIVGQMGGIPKAEVEIIGGLQVYDPRLDITPGGDITNPAYFGPSTNASLALADLISNTTWGGGRAVDWASVVIAADANDEIPPGSTTGLPRRRFGLSINATRTVGQWVEHLQKYAGVFLSDVAGAVLFVPDRPATSVADIGPSRIVLGSTSWRKAVDLDLPDDVIVRYYDLQSGTQKEVSALGAVVGRISKFDLLGLHDYEIAHREAIETYNHLVLEDLTGSLLTDNRGMLLDVGDVVRVTDPSAGIVDKPFRITKISSPNPGFWGLDLMEYQANAYSDLAQTAPLEPDFGLPSATEIPIVTGLNVVVEYMSPGGAGPYVPRFVVTWDDMLLVYQSIRKYHVQAVRADGSQIIDWRSDVLSDAQEARSDLLEAETSYDVRVRIESSATVGEWVTITLNLAADTTPPGPVTAATLVVDGPGNIAGLFNLRGRWTAPPDPDVKYYRLKLYKLTDGSDAGDIIFSDSFEAEITAQLPTYVFTNKAEDPGAGNTYSYSLRIWAIDWVGNSSLEVIAPTLWI